MQPIIRECADGVRLCHIPDARFTTARVLVVFYAPLDIGTASENAVIPYLLRRGCAAYPDFAAFQQKLSALYGVQTNAFVDRTGETQELGLGFSFLSDKYALNGEQIELQCADLLSQMLFDPVLEDGAFRASDFVQEERCLLESVRAKINEKRYYARMQAKNFTFENDRYAIDPNGDEAHIERMTAQTVTAAWRRLIQTAPVQIIYQGNADPDTVLAPLIARFSARGTDDVFTMTPYRRHETPLRVDEALDITQSKLVMTFHTSVTDGDGAEPALRLANAVLGGSTSSLLFMNVREKQSLCYYCASSFESRKGVLVIDSGVQPEKAADAERAISEQLDALKRGDFTEDDLSAARLSLINLYRSAEDMPGLLQMFYADQMHREAPVTPTDKIADFEAITKEQVIAAAGTLTLDSVYLLHPKEEVTA